jgi:myosin heavy subunit
MVKLNALNEAALLHNLRLRFKNDKIYTNVGTILISVNPFKQLPIYTPQVLDSYKSAGAKGLPPHVYGVAGFC